MVLALQAGEVETLTPIRLRYTGELHGPDRRRATTRTCCTPRSRRSTSKIVNTTVGRVIFNDALPEQDAASSTAC